MMTSERRKTMTWTYRHRKQLLIAGGIFMLSVICFFFIFSYQSTTKPKKKQEPVVLAGNEEKEDISKEEQENNTDIYYQVDIKGEVNTPGIYSVKQGSRVIDVIRLAGDLTENADTSVINLSKKVADEMVIIIYSYEEVKNFTETKAQEEQKQEKCVQATEEAVVNDACIESGQEEVSITGPISLSQATKEELMTLEGIGEAKAAAIIAYRDEHGPFTNIEEIKNVNGIGDELFAKIKESITP